MEKNITEHLNFIQTTLKKGDVNFDWKALSDLNRAHIGFFQHERLIHLLITLFFGFIFLAGAATALISLNTSSNVTFLTIGLLAITAIVSVMLIFYILHYFFLENSVQKLYQLENEIVKRFA